MPLTRYRIKDEYGLADPEIYRSADKDDPEALLEGVAMAGLVGLLRQLGDLAEFAAEIFHDLHEEVMATAARGHGLTVRIQQLEAEFPPIEKALLLQTNHSLYYSNAGSDWHPNLHIEKNLIARGDLPRFVMDSYEESRGPPHLFLLDKFDIAGAGACLKRYTDPSFLKMDTVSSGLSTTDVQREKKTRRGKKKGSRWRNEETPECVPSHAKLHQLFMEECIENAYSDPTRRVKLKRRQLNRSPFDSKSERSLMEKFVETPLLESKTIREVPLSLPSLEWRSDDTSGQGLGEVEISNYSPVKISQENGSADSLLYKDGFKSNHFFGDVEDLESTANGEEEEIPCAVAEEKEVLINGADNKDGRSDGYISEEMTSEVDSYVDALATMESDVEKDSNWRLKQDMHLQNVEKGGKDLEANEELELQMEFSASQSVGNSGSDDEDSSYGRSSSCFSNQHGGDRFSNASVPTKRTGTDSVTSSDNQFLYNKETQDRESEELRVSSCTDIEDKGLPCPTASDMAGPLDAKSLLDGSEHNKASVYMGHGHGIPYSETDANPVDSAANQIQDDSVSTNSVECLTNDVGANSEVCFKEMEHPVDFLEMPSQTGSDYFSVNEMLNMETVAENTAENLSTVLSESDSSTKENDQFSLMAAAVDSISTAGSEVIETAIRLESSTLQADETQLDETATERNMSNVDVEGNEGITEESSRKVDAENIDSLNLNVNVEGVASMSDSNDHANSIDLVVAGDNLDDSAAVGCEQFLVRGESATFRESLSDVDAHKDEGNYEVERIISTYDTKLGEEETTLGILSEVSVSENPTIFDNSVSDEAYGGGVANSGVAPSDEYRLNYLDREDADYGYSSSVNLEDSDSDIRVLSGERLDRIKLGVIEEKNELEVGPPFSEPTYSDSLYALDQESLPHNHTNAAVDNSQSSVAEKTQSTDSYDDYGDDVVTPPVNATLASESKNFLVEQLQTETAEDQEKSEAVGSEYLSELEEGGFPDELSESNEATKLLGNQFESESPIIMNQEICEDSSSKERLTALPAYTNDPAFGLLSEEAGINPEDTPPLPPLPPMQWIGKLQNASTSSQTDIPGLSFGLLPPLQPFAADEKSYSSIHTSEERALPSGDQHSSLFGHEHDQLQHDLYQTGPNPFSLPMPFLNRDMHIQSNVQVVEEKQLTSSSLLHNTEATEPPELTSLALCGVVSQTDLSTCTVEEMAENRISECGPESSSSVQSTAQIHPQKFSEAVDFQDTAEKPEEDKCTDSFLPTHKIHQPTISGVQDLQHSPETAEVGNCSDSYTVEQPQYNLPNNDGHFSTEMALQANSESGKPNGTLASNIPRPPKPLIDAVAAHDRSKLRKVAERVRADLAPKLEERDSMLEQIRAKSFNLKPAVLTRPSVHQGPKTNLRVAAILEKANAIRQALAGSDEDDDEDSWSDSD